ncbi:U6 snRNA-associated Sm-like protein LSm4 isoform X2 [Suricata suricatta]|uniref:U6 snRNA-associated Sm-like protein LSm4 isoform X2 n=1 Tax=Suricata suricatta TaxID=37032 RepID=UPI0011554487|nr:U6 snRNA-associated Sm-like protein LSm4 isoform X2 [Suricata suricatta]
MRESGHEEGVLEGCRKQTLSHSGGQVRNEEAISCDCLTPPAKRGTKSLERCHWKTAPQPQDGDKFWRMPECYIRGSTIKYLRIPDEIIDMVKEEVVAKGRGRGGLQQQKQQKGRGMGGAGRGVFGGRGRGGIPGTGRGQPEKKPGRQAAKQ